MEHIIQKDALDSYKFDMARYSIETNRRRSFPDYRDGFKLIHRRIIHAMMNDIHADKRLIKTAKVTGQVMGTYHPHGDTSISDAIKPLSNWFEINMPLIYSESNMGSMQGDGAAAPRYTEVMLSKFCIEAVLKDLYDCKKVVDWVANFDNTSEEPEYLPVAVPLLLINGSYGIGVGKIVSIPPHNITEVLDATLRVLRDPSAPVVLIPDQLTPCEIIDTNWKQISNLGKGSFKVRSVIEIETFDKGKAKEHYALIIKGAPIRTWIDKGNAENGGIIYRIHDLIASGKLPQIEKIDEDSHNKDMRIVIHLKRGADPNYVKEYLYKSTQLQDSIPVNFEVLNGIDLVPMSYKAYIEAFIEQRKVTKFRLYCTKLQEFKTKFHEKEAYYKALNSGRELDNIIKCIRKNTITEEQKNIEWLCNLLNITDLQAKYILNLPLKAISTARIPQLKADMDEYQKKIDFYMYKILHEESIIQDIEDELLYFRNKYGKPRFCKVISKSDASNIPQGEFKVVVTENNYIKKLSPNDYIGAYKGDIPIHVKPVQNTEDIILITAQGRMFKLPVHKIPLTEKNTVGTDLRLLIKGLMSSVVKVLYGPELQTISNLAKKHFVIMITEQGFIKKMDIEDITIATPSGIIMTKLSEGDRVKAITIAPDDFDIIVYSKRKALRFSVQEIPHYKRNTIGVQAMKTSECIDGISLIDPSSTNEVVVITEAGRVNKFNVNGLLRTSRNRAGSGVIKLSKGDTIHSVLGVNDNDTLKITTRAAETALKVTDIPASSSVAAGAKLINLKADNLINIAII